MSGNEKVKVLVTFSKEEIDLLEAQAKKVKLSRNMFFRQVCRKHLGLPSVIKEDD